MHEALEGDSCGAGGSVSGCGPQAEPAVGAVPIQVQGSDACYLVFRLAATVTEALVCAHASLHCSAIVGPHAVRFRAVD